MHVALARQYRPHLFRDVVGQDMFIRILRNALSQGRVGHGLLLTGIRGVGKTTIARLVAKALCCMHRDNDQEPCNICSSCTAFNQEKHVDILELDAASHTGVDDMRQILESCLYRPLLGPYKVYIMDEVHMLSKSAFNALLKTLEEPPSHVKFIFATTDVSKVPLTIVSRCQQLHLNRVKTSVLIPYLEKITQKEGFSVVTEALSLLAQCSEGGVRDALSLLERVLLVSASNQKITLEDVLDILGLPHQETLENMITALEKSDIRTVLSLVGSLYHQGIEPMAILTQMMHRMHEKTMEHWKKSTLGISEVSLERWDQWWQLAQKGLTELAGSPFPLLALEMLLLRMAYMTKFPTPSHILSLIEPLPPHHQGFLQQNSQSQTKVSEDVRSQGVRPETEGKIGPELKNAPNRTVQKSSLECIKAYSNGKANDKVSHCSDHPKQNKGENPKTHNVSDPLLHYSSVNNFSVEKKSVNEMSEERGSKVIPSFEKVPSEGKAVEREPSQFSSYSTPYESNMQKEEQNHKKVNAQGNFLKNIAENSCHLSSSHRQNSLEDDLASVANFEHDVRGNAAEKSTKPPTTDFTQNYTSDLVQKNVLTPLDREKFVDFSANQKATDHIYPQPPILSDNGLESSRYITGDDFKFSATQGLQPHPRDIPSNQKDVQANVLLGSKISTVHDSGPEKTMSTDFFGQQKALLTSLKNTDVSQHARNAEDPLSDLVASVSHAPLVVSSMTSVCPALSEINTALTTLKKSDSQKFDTNSVNISLKNDDFPSPSSTRMPSLDSPSVTRATSSDAFPTTSPITIGSIAHLLRALEQHREGLLHAYIRQNVSWISSTAGELFLHWDVSRGVMPHNFGASLEKFIQSYTGSKCRIVWQDQARGLSQRAQEESDKAHLNGLARAHPDLQNLLHAFPDIIIEEVALL